MLSAGQAWIVAGEFWRGDDATMHGNDDETDVNAQLIEI
jgi:hypothetical protein